MHDAVRFDLSAAVERNLDELNEIFNAMRWLEFTHALNPHDQDLADYQMLIDDLAAGARKLAQALPTTPHAVHASAALAARDFPVMIGDTLTVSPATSTSKPRDQSPGRSPNHGNQ